MSDFPNDIGHWQRINDSAGPLYERPLNLPLVVQDLCRALLDLHDLHRKAKADAWDEALGEVSASYTIPMPDNPYRQEASDE